MRLRAEPGLTFDDVLLVPRHSRITSRSQVSTRSQLTPAINLEVPLLSANMDTVTEAEMAIAMARAGGLGVIHRFMPIEAQQAQVARVKRSEGVLVERPVTLGLDAAVGDARRAMAESGIGGLVVIDRDDRVAGIVTRRDLLFAPDDDLPITGLMTPLARLVTGPADISPAEARRILHEHRLEKLPLIAQDGRLAGLVTAQDIVKQERFPQATKDGKGRLRVGAAIGARLSDIDRARACLEAGADVIVVDLAHGHSENCLEMVRQVRRLFPQVPIIGGNIATPEGVRDLAEAGASAVKVGVGSGSICITRLVTGFGVPQLTALLDCAEVAHTLGVPLIADGGIRGSGDIAKALAAGASTVMLGGMLAGTDEAPGATVTRDGQKAKIVRGMASLTANIDRLQLERGEDTDPGEWERVVPEGIEAVVPYRGSVSDIVGQLVGGLRSAMSYAGAETIQTLWQRAEFVRLTPAGQVESGVHDVTRLG
jgi:IMP dehydrogenase